MSISSVSSSAASSSVAATAASSFASASQTADQIQAEGAAPTAAEVAASSATSVTLNSTPSWVNDQPPLTYDQLLAQATQSDKVLHAASYTTDDSVTILMTGQNKMAYAIDAFDEDWTKVQQVIGSERPDLLKQTWDINTDDGTIQVVSNTMSASDKAWLTGVLNQSKGLVADTQTINTILVSTFGGTAAEAAEDPTGMTLSSLTQSTVDGKVHFLSLLAGIDNGVNPFNGSNLMQKEVDGSSLLPVAGEIGDMVNPTCASPGDWVDGYSLNVAYIQYLYPALAQSSVQDGTANPLAGLNLTATAADQPFVNEFSTALSGMMVSMDSLAMTEANNRTQQWLASAQTSLASELGSNYRTYGEALSAEAGSSTTADPSSGAASSVTLGPSIDGTPSVTTTTGVGSIPDVYQTGGTTLNAAQKAIQSIMQTFGQDWNTSKATIAATRPGLLSQNWDFVTDEGTIQAVSSGSLTAEQQLWLTGILNQNANLVADTQTINKDLVNFYNKGAGSNAQATAKSASSHTLANLTLQSIDGTVDFLALMGGADPGTMIQQGLDAKYGQSAST